MKNLIFYVLSLVIAHGVSSCARKVHKAFVKADSTVSRAVTDNSEWERVVVNRWVPDMGLRMAGPSIGGASTGGASTGGASTGLSLTDFDRSGGRWAQPVTSTSPPAPSPWRRGGYGQPPDNSGHPERSVEYLTPGPSPWRRGEGRAALSPQNVNRLSNGVGDEYPNFMEVEPGYVLEQIVMERGKRATAATENKSVAVVEQRKEADPSTGLRVTRTILGIVVLALLTVLLIIWRAKNEI